MLLVSVADVEVKYRTVEVPETCPMCVCDGDSPVVGSVSNARKKADLGESSSSRRS